MASASAPTCESFYPRRRHRSCAARPASQYIPPAWKLLADLSYAFLSASEPVFQGHAAKPEANISCRARKVRSEWALQIDRDCIAIVRDMDPLARANVEDAPALGPTLDHVANSQFANCVVRVAHFFAEFGIVVVHYVFHGHLFLLDFLLNDRAGRGRAASVTWQSASENVFREFHPRWAERCA